VVVLLLSGGGVTWLRESFTSSQKDSIETISAEEFSKLMRQAKKRHDRHVTNSDSAIDQSKQRGAEPDTKPVDSAIASRWRETFDTSTISRLESFDVTPAAPSTMPPAFTASTLSGETVSLSSFSDRWIIINFWATWCVPCREEMPSLNRLDERMGSRLDVVGIDVGQSKSEILQFVKSVEIDFTIVLDPETTITERFGTEFLPESWLIGPGGSVYGVVQGPRDWSSRESTRLFESIVDTGVTNSTTMKSNGIGS